MKKLLLLTTTIFLIASTAFAQSKEIAANEKTEAPVETAFQIPTDKKIARVFIVGDSTASPFNDPYYLPRYGFGTKVQDYLLSKKAAVVNLAVSGRSSVSFITDASSAKNYALLKENIRKGDFLIIAFGHNDEKLEAERYSDPNGNKETKGSFKYSLYENYVKIAQNAKATPILVTPIVRYSPEGDYSGANAHITTGNEEYAGGDYAKAIRELGSEIGVTVVDQTENTKQLYESIGSEAALLHAQNSKNEKSLDKTHLNVYGASKIAYMLVTDLASKDKKFKKLVIKNPLEPSIELRVPNPNYVEPGTGAPTAKSSVFTTTEPWWASVFGDCGGQGKIANPDLYEITETATGVSMHSGSKDCKTAAGKISSATDGIAFYFQQIAADKDFSISATATVINIKANNQVSFGIMARDNVLIDTADSGVSTNYVAAGPLKLTAADWKSTFARDGGALVETAAQVESVPSANTVVEISLVKEGNIIRAKYGNEEAKEYTVDLTQADKDNIYIGFYTVRNAVVDFSNIKVEIK